MPDDATILQILQEHDEAQIHALRAGLMLLEIRESMSAHEFRRWLRCECPLGDVTAKTYLEAT